MQEIEIYQVDAFTDKVFHGNPAAVCILDEWLNDELLQAIAAEKNLSETAFIVADKDHYHIRWFAPSGEISLCGHATLAAGFVLFELDKWRGDCVNFQSMSGNVAVNRCNDQFELNFPTLHSQLKSLEDLPEGLIDQTVEEYWENELDIICILPSHREVLKAKINPNILLNLDKRGLVITGAASDYDFHSRCFYPKHKIQEDPVTGSAHCALTPIWQQKLNKPQLIAMQGSTRMGTLKCGLKEERVVMSGNCRWFMKGKVIL